MKKLRISLRDSSKNWSIPVYESLTSYLKFHDFSETSHTDYKELIDHRTLVTLNAGEFLEIEWMGVDYCYADELEILLSNKITKQEMSRRCDNVRIGKRIHKAGRSGFDYVTGYEGYVPGNIIPWVIRDAPRYLKVIKLNGRFKSKIDFESLFEEKEEVLAKMILGSSIEEMC